ncbi:MAG TPA: acyl carrier protein [Mycobacteriales bacterium]|nr:acyl carrier protein [Mycobacteriales bacterium]
MTTQHSPADDIVYNLVSVQYHALKAAQAYDSYVQDAEGHDDVQAFFQQCAQQDADRAKKCHELLAQLTGSGGLSSSS